MTNNKQRPQSVGPPTWLGVIAVILYDVEWLVVYIMGGAAVAVFPLGLVYAAGQSVLWVLIPVGVFVLWFWVAGVVASVFEYLWPSEQQLECRIDFVVERVAPAI